MKLVKLLLVSTFMLFAAPALAEPADIEYFDAQTTCFDEFGNLLLAQSSRQVVITNDGEGTVNVSIKGTCPTTSDSAVNFSDFDFPGIGCNAGSGGVLLYWKYHMRPDGKYSGKCSSYPLED